MTIRLKTAAIAVASALAVGAAAANDSTATGNPSGGTGVLGSVPHSTERTSVFAVDETEFMRLDTDHDGRLNRAETTGLAPLQHDWQRVDADGDGYLSREELARHHAEGGTKSADAETKPTTGGESRLPADRSPQPTGSSGATTNGSTSVPDNTLTQPLGSNTPR